MKALPRPLSLWAEELGHLGVDAQVALGPWLPTLDRLLGPHPRDLRDQQGEPDGLSGLGRHGRYERLALSEWALLDVAPEEFLRRTGSGEHLFHQITRVGRAGGQRIVALFDAGPLQLGAPRLAHLAWLLVMARRAARTGARLGWGILQAPDAGLKGDCDPPALRALLAARSRRVASGSEQAGWIAQLGPASDGEERWLVGGETDPRFNQVLGAGTLSVAEPDEPGEDALRVAAVHPHLGATRIRALLRLPTTDVCARLVRDPFPVVPRPPSAVEEETLAPGAQFVFSASGTHLVARLVSGELVALAVPPRPEEAEAVRPLARFTPAAGEEVVAAGWRRGKLCVVTVGEKGVRLHIGRGSRWRTIMREVKGQVAPPRPSPAVLSGLVVDGDVFWFVDAGWRLYHGFISGGYLFSVPETVLAWAWANGCMTTVGRVGAGPLELFAHRRNGLDRTVLATGEPRASEGYLAVETGGKTRIAAVSAGDGEWTLHATEPPAATAVRLRPRTTVFGALRLQGVPALLVRHGDDAVLHIVDGEQRTHALSPLLQEVEHAALQPGGSLIAAQVAGELVVFDRERKRRLRWGRRRS